MSVTERDPAPPRAARRAPPEPSAEVQAIMFVCPCPRVGRACAGCILPPMGARPPLRYPVGRLLASVAGPVWHLRGWLYGLTHDE
jgi:hypothetical protein